MSSFKESLPNEVFYNRFNLGTLDLFNTKPENPTVTG